MHRIKCMHDSQLIPYLVTTNEISHFYAIMLYYIILLLLLLIIIKYIYIAQYEYWILGRSCKCAFIMRTHSVVVLNHRCWQSLGGQYGKGVDGLFEKVSFQMAFEGVESGWKCDIKS